MLKATYLWGRQWGPARLVLVTFAAAIGVGTLLLWLPASSAGPGLTFSEALFTATSAACVTGLSVLDTGSDLSLFGQLIVFALFQLGGLGIMTFSTLGMVLMGRQLRLIERVLASGHVGARHSMPDARNVVRNVVLMAVAFELCGAALLALRWPAETRIGAVWAGAFHAASAFCNAGFALQADSLAFMRGDWLSGIVVMTLIIAGGIGFPVILEIRALIRHIVKRDWAPGRSISLHTKVVVATSLVLTALGAAAVFLVDGAYSLDRLSFGEVLLASVFQSVTTRTAGFSTVDIGALQPTSLFVFMLLMFVGGSPGSTAGGVKTTAIGTLAALIWSRWRGSDTVDVCRRTIPATEVRRAVTLVASFVTILVLGVLALLVTEQASAFASGGTIVASSTHGLFLDVAFEATSALGTVGLSTGLTPEVSAPGRLVLIGLMYLGRVGPLTVAVAITERQRRTSYQYPEESVIIG